MNETVGYAVVKECWLRRGIVISLDMESQIVNGFSLLLFSIAGADRDWEFMGPLCR